MASSVTSAGSTPSATSWRTACTTSARPAVVEGEVHAHAVVAGGELHRCLDASAQRIRYRGEVADVPQADARVMQRIELAVDGASREPQQVVGLGARPTPVLGREGEEREYRNLVLGEAFQDAPDALGAGAVALLAAQSAFARPAAVAVHDDCDVLGPVREVGARKGLRGRFNDHAASPSRVLFPCERRRGVFKASRRLCWQSCRPSAYAHARSARSR